MNLNQYFKKVWSGNLFGGGESLSGRGSSLIQTTEIRKKLPELFKQLEIESLLDLPCGDAHWIKHANFLGIKEYVGADIVTPLIKKLKREFRHRKQIKFKKINLIEEKSLPKSDLMLCRDLLVHLSFQDIERSLVNIKNSDIKFVGFTTFTEVMLNEDLTYRDPKTHAIGWRPINLTIEPFNFPPPVILINEKCTESDGIRVYSDKSLGIWRVKDL